MQMATSIEADNGEMIVKRVSVPIGLEELMEGLTKEVILKKPKDIYVFASQYFAKLLNLREKGSLKVTAGRRVQSVTKQISTDNVSKHLKAKSKSVEPIKQLSRQISIRSDSPAKKTLMTKKIVLNSKEEKPEKPDKTKAFLDKRKARKDSRDEIIKKVPSVQSDRKDKRTPRSTDRFVAKNKEENVKTPRRGSQSETKLQKMNSAKTNNKVLDKSSEDTVDSIGKTVLAQAKGEDKNNIDHLDEIPKQAEENVVSTNEKDEIVDEGKDVNLKNNEISESANTKDVTTGCALKEDGALDLVCKNTQETPIVPTDVEIIPSDISNKSQEETSEIDKSNTNDTKSSGQIDSQKYTDITSQDAVNEPKELANEKEENSSVANISSIDDAENSLPVDSTQNEADINNLTQNSSETLTSGKLDSKNEKEENSEITNVHTSDVTNENDQLKLSSTENTTSQTKNEKNTDNLDGDNDVKNDLLNYEDTNENTENLDAADSKQNNDENSNIKDTHDAEENISKDETDNSIKELSSDVATIAGVDKNIENFQENKENINANSDTTKKSDIHSDIIKAAATNHINNSARAANKSKEHLKIKNSKTKSLSEENLKIKDTLKDKDTKRVKRIKSVDSHRKDPPKPKSSGKTESIMEQDSNVADAANNKKKRTRRSASVTKEPKTIEKQPKSFDASKLREEIKEANELKKVTNFKPTYNPYKLRQEIKQASGDDGTHEPSNMSKVAGEVAAAIKIQSLWRGFSFRKHNRNENGLMTTSKIVNVAAVAATEHLVKDEKQNSESDANLGNTALEKENKIEDIKTEEGLRKLASTEDFAGKDFEKKESDMQQNAVVSEIGNLKAQVEDPNSKKLEAIETSTSQSDEKQKDHEGTSNEDAAVDEIQSNNSKNEEEAVNATPTEIQKLEKGEDESIVEHLPRVKDEQPMVETKSELLEPKTVENDLSDRENEIKTNKALVLDERLENSTLGASYASNLEPKQNEVVDNSNATENKKEKEANETTHSLEEHVEKEKTIANHTSNSETKMDDSVDYSSLTENKKETETANATPTVLEHREKDETELNHAANTETNENKAVNNSDIAEIDNKTEAVKTTSAPEEHIKKVDEILSNDTEIKPEAKEDTTLDISATPANKKEKIMDETNLEKHIEKSETEQNLTPASETKQEVKENVILDKEIETNKELNKEIEKTVVEIENGDAKSSTETTTMKLGETKQTESKANDLLENFAEKHTTKENNQPNNKPELEKSDSTETANVVEEKIAKEVSSIANQGINNRINEPESHNKNKQQAEHLDINIGNSTKLDMADAVLRIQALWRGFRIRKQLRRGQLFGDTIEKEVKNKEALEAAPKISKEKAVSKIQALWRGYRVRRNIKEVDKRLAELQKPSECDEMPSQRELSDEDIFKAATKIQAGVRGYMVRKKRSTISNLKSIAEETSPIEKLPDEQVLQSLHQLHDIPNNSPELVENHDTTDQPDVSGGNPVNREEPGNELASINKTAVDAKADNKKTKNASELNSTTTNKLSNLEATAIIADSISNGAVNNDEVGPISSATHAETGYTDAPTRPVTSNVDEVVNKEIEESQRQKPEDNNQNISSDRGHGIVDKLEEMEEVNKPPLLSSQESSADSIATVIFNDTESQPVLVSEEKCDEKFSSEENHETIGTKDQNVDDTSSKVEPEKKSDLPTKDNLEDLERKRVEGKTNDEDDKKLDLANKGEEIISKEKVTPIETLPSDHPESTEKSDESSKDEAHETSLIHVDNTKNMKIGNETKDGGENLNETRENVKTSEEIIEPNEILAVKVEHKPDKVEPTENNKTSEAKDATNFVSEKHGDLSVESDNNKLNIPILESEIRKSNEQLQNLHENPVEDNLHLNKEKTNVDDVIDKTTPTANSNNKLNIPALKEEIEDSNKQSQDMVIKRSEESNKLAQEASLDNSASDDTKTENLSVSSAGETRNEDKTFSSDQSDERETPNRHEEIDDQSERDSLRVHIPMRELSEIKEEEGDIKSSADSVEDLEEESKSSSKSSPPTSNQNIFEKTSAVDLGVKETKPLELGQKSDEREEESKFVVSGKPDEQASDQKKSRQKSAGTTINLVHSGEFHDTITVPISVTPPARTSPQEGENPSTSRQTSPQGLVHTGELHDNVLPLSVQLDEAPPAGAEVLTSPVSESINTDGQKRAQASNKDASTCGAEPQPDNTPSPASMETEKRNNATTVQKKSMEAEAATKIQAGFRGYQVRKQLKNKISAPGDISNQRRSARRKSSGRLTESGRITQSKSKKPSDLEEKSAVKIQAGVRGFLVRRRQKKQKQGKESS